VADLDRAAFVVAVELATITVEAADLGRLTRAQGPCNVRLHDEAWGSVVISVRT
jgi:hypothetical protein